ncbi:lipoprotein-releasing ABC transporter permease subunit [soil metagenome]
MTDAVAGSKPAKPAGAFSSWEIGLALRYLRAKRKEGGVALIAIISFFGIMLAVMALIVVLSIMSGFRSELLGRMLSFNGHMYVTGAVLTSPDRDAALARIKAVPGVVTVSPLIETQALISAAGQTTGAIVRGLRPQDLGTMQYVSASLSEEAKASFGRGSYGGNNILIGQALADQLGVRVGDPITVYSPTGADSAFGNLGGQSKTYFVGGTYSSGTADYDRAFVFMPLEQAQLFFGKEGLWDVIEMKVAQPDEIKSYTGAVRDAAGPGSLVTDWTERLAAFWGALKVERVAMSIILGMVVAIAALNIISGIVMLVKNKTRDIAILRTIGASPSSILRVFFMAGATIGVAGALVGLLLGLVFCLNIGAIQHFLEFVFQTQLFNADVYMLDAIPAKVDPMDVVWITLWSVFMSCIASLIPSWLATRIDPIEALRYE